MDKKERTLLRKYFNKKSCPFFGAQPVICQEKGSVIRDCELVILDARTFLRVCSPTNSICPPFDEIKAEIASGRSSIWGTPPEETIDPGSIDIKELFGFSEKQILAARAFHQCVIKDFSGKWSAIFTSQKLPVIMDKAITFLWGPQAKGKAGISKGKGKRPKHFDVDFDNTGFDDWDALAVLSISVAYAILGDVAAGKDDEHFPDAINLAQSFLSEAEDILIRISKEQIMVGREFGIKGGVFGSEGGKKKKGKKLKSAQEKKKRWQGWATDIWERRSTWTNTDVARRIKEQHPKTKDSVAWIARNISKPYC